MSAMQGWDLEGTECMWKGERGREDWAFVYVFHISWFLDLSNQKIDV
jgi:hypothetical protein